MNKETEVCVALLQDIVYQTKTTLADIDYQFTFEIAHNVRILTYDNRMSYFDYLRKIKKNPIAYKVKYYSLLHNLDESRYGEKTCQTITLLKSYKEWFDYLTNTESINPNSDLPDIMSCPFCDEEIGLVNLEHS